MLEEVTPADLKAIMRELIDQARMGDIAAARLVLAYAVGKPDKVVDPVKSEESERIDATNTARPPAEIGMRARKPQTHANPAREDGWAKCDTKRDTTVRQDTHLVQMNPGSEMQVAAASRNNMCREEEREVRLGFLREIARRLIDQQRPTRTDVPPTPKANGLFNGPPQP